ncbi:alpha/beta hydrolase [Psychroserpens sp.]|uniref:alpha/beta fold hydrolase n=1 Tax=Psychroserpens sp. TaxID=2020870 RepID=UPI001B1510FD|nr:alpha/beta hydrolase [Psychroserpens sp.]MBO6608029.1 alpha/beta hydrolase [Psychroserpens sp.]MBO6632618.1 alpha/beta hydrolase [Psychroserpens sp.]MBO6655139.1 alpha/beta hydrolase [Psychroserpens sp.]MBO6683239.1 alpha/beta hydrolase [Psychroserpens sp.]MBO6751402.1 alpha/beta hydrolase [Psychroserpens sp.]
MRQLIAKCIGATLNVLSWTSPKTSAKLAIKLFSTPRRTKLKEDENDFLSTAYREDIKYEHLNIMTYRWIGDKETILLAHGWESNAYRWKGLIEELKDRNYSIVALDAPAHGNTNGKSFNAILYSECIHAVAKKFETDIVIGHSVGGMATAFFYSKYKLPHINKLVLLGAPSNFVGVFQRYRDMMGYNERLAKAMNQFILDKYNNAPEYFNAAKFLSDVAISGLIIHDEGDPIIPYNDAEDFDTFYKNAKLITTKGYGHRLKSNEINQHIIEFINT